MEDIIRKAVGEGVAVETVIGAGLWNTLVDPGNLENALLNMAINARDAMEGQGRLIIEAGQCRPGFGLCDGARDGHARRIRDGRGDRHRLRHVARK